MAPIYTKMDNAVSTIGASEGYDYIFNSKGLLTHPYYIEWIKESVAKHSE